MRISDCSSDVCSSDLKVAEAANEAGPGRATYLHCDISSRTGVDTAFERGARAMGGIDGLVNAAGIERHIDPQDITDDDWDVLMAINVTGTFLTNQEIGRASCRERVCQTV